MASRMIYVWPLKNIFFNKNSKLIFEITPNSMAAIYNYLKNILIQNVNLRGHENRLWKILSFITPGKMRELVKYLKIYIIFLLFLFLRYDKCSEKEHCLKNIFPICKVISQCIIII